MAVDIDSVSDQDAEDKGTISWNEIERNLTKDLEKERLAKQSTSKP